MDHFAAMPSLSYPDPMPFKPPGAGSSGLTNFLASTAVNCDWHYMSSPRASGLLSPATATDESTAATHNHTQSPDLQGSPPRLGRYILCPGPPTKRLPTKHFCACPAAASGECQCFVAAPLKQDSPQVREADNMSQLISAAQPVRSAQELLHRLRQMSGTAMARSAQGPQSKRMRVDSRFPLPATAGARCFNTAELMDSYCTQDALEGFHEDQAPIRADHPVGTMVKSSAVHSDSAFQQPPSHQSVEGQTAFTKFSAKPCISNSGPEPMLAFTEGSSTASTQSKDHCSRQFAGGKIGALPIGELNDDSVGQGLPGTTASLSPVSQFFPTCRPMIFMTSFNLPLDHPLPPTLRPFFTPPSRLALGQQLFCLLPRQLRAQDVTAQLML